MTASDTAAGAITPSSRGAPMSSSGSITPPGPVIRTSCEGAFLMAPRTSASTPAGSASHTPGSCSWAARWSRLSDSSGSASAKPRPPDRRGLTSVATKLSAVAMPSTLNIPRRPAARARCFPVLRQHSLICSPRSRFGRHRVDVPHSTRPGSPSVLSVTTSIGSNTATPRSSTRPIMLHGTPSTNRATRTRSASPRRASSAAANRCRPDTKRSPRAPPQNPRLESRATTRPAPVSNHVAERTASSSVVPMTCGGDGTPSSRQRPSTRTLSSQRAHSGRRHPCIGRPQNDGVLAYWLPSTVSDRPGSTWSSQAPTAAPGEWSQRSKPRLPMSSPCLLRSRTNGTAGASGSRGVAVMTTDTSAPCSRNSSTTGVAPAPNPGSSRAADRPLQYRVNAARRSSSTAFTGRHRSWQRAARRRTRLRPGCRTGMRGGPPPPEPRGHDRPGPGSGRRCRCRGAVPTAAP